MSSIGVDWQARVDWDQLRAHRAHRLQQSLEAHSLDGVLVQRFDNVRYTASARPFTSIVYYPRYAVFVPRGGEVCFLTEAGDYELNKAGMPWIHDLRIWSYDLAEVLDTLEALLSESDLSQGRIGFDDIVSPAIVQGLAIRMPGLEFVDGTQAVYEAKAVKHPEEIKVLRQAIEIAEIGMAAARDSIREGQRESDVAAELTRAMFAAGADALIAHPQVSTDPLRRMASDRRIRHGELVLVDINVGYNGYIGDFARTYVAGTPTPDQKDVFGTQLACVQAAIGAVRPGATTAEIQSAVEDVVARAGLAEFWHGYITGHGLGTGLGPYEQPVVGTRTSFMPILEAGMVIAFEPGIFKPGVGPMRNEEVVLVTEDGSEVLTRSPYDERLTT